MLQIRGKGGVKFLGRQLHRDQEDAAREILADAHIEHAEIIVRTEFDAQLLRRQTDGELPLPTVLIGTHRSTASADADELGALWPESRLLRLEVDPSMAAGPICDLLLEAVGYTQVELLERPTPDAARKALLVHRSSDIAQVADRAGVSTKRLKGARVWGDSVPRPGQAVRLDHLIEAKDRMFLQS